VSKDEQISWRVPTLLTLECFPGKQYLDEKYRTEPIPKELLKPDYSSVPMAEEMIKVCKKRLENKFGISFKEK